MALAEQVNLTISEYKIETLSINRLEVRESVFLPFPTCAFTFVANHSFSTEIALYVGTPITIRMLIDGVDIEQDFFLLDCKENPVGDDLTSFSIVGIGATLNVLMKFRRAFIEMDSVTALETLYQDLGAEPIVEIDSSNDVMNWMQLGSWVEMWGELVSNSYLNDEDMLLAFKDLDGNAVVTSLNRIFEFEPVTDIVYNPNATQSQETKINTTPIISYSSHFDGMGLMFGSSVTGINTFDFDELTYESISGVWQEKNEEIEGRISPLAHHLFKGVVEHNFVMKSDNVHSNWGYSKILNKKLKDQLTSNTLRVVSNGSKSLLVGTNVNVSTPNNNGSQSTRNRYEGKWLVKSNYYLLADPKVPLQVISMLTNTNINQSTFDKKESK